MVLNWATYYIYLYLKKEFLGADIYIYMYSDIEGVGSRVQGLRWRQILYLAMQGVQCQRYPTVGSS